MMTEDEILDAYGVLDDLETSRKLEACQRRVVVLEARLRERPTVVRETTVVAEWQQKAEHNERLYLAALARCKVLSRKVRELNG